MSTNVTWNGTTYAIPASGETGWSALSNFLIALGNNAAISEEMKQAVRVATTTPVTVADTTDCVVATNMGVASAVAVNLPAGVNGRWFVIVDQKGDAATNNITITPNGAETINGAATYVISRNNDGVILVYSSTNTRWNVVGRFTSGSPLTNPMTTTGDTIYSADNSGTPARLAAVSAGQLLVSAGTGTAPAWGSTVSAATTFSNTTDASSSTTGGLIASGGVGIAKKLNVGDATDGTSGAGSIITAGGIYATKAIYSATTGTFTSGVKVKNTGAGSDTLTWYEEGTWTPTVASSGTAFGSVTYSVQVGLFTRIGRAVHFNCYVIWTNTTGSPTGSLLISGLPYTSKNTSNAYTVFALQASNIDTVGSGTNTWVVGQLPPNATSIYITACGDNSAGADVAASSNGGATTRAIQTSGTYFV